MTKAALVRYRIVRARPNAGDEELSSIEYNRMETICYLGTLAAAAASHHFFELTIEDAASDAFLCASKCSRESYVASL
jgi:hypothetical protein